jgi:hypothetical protein
MKDIDLFQMALGLRAVWQVLASEFDLKQKRLDILINFPKGSTFACPARRHLIAGVSAALRILKRKERLVKDKALNVFAVAAVAMHEIEKGEMKRPTDRK